MPAAVPAKYSSSQRRVRAMTAVSPSTICAAETSGASRAFETRQPLLAARASLDRRELERAQPLVRRQRQHVAEGRREDGAKELHDDR